MIFSIDTAPIVKGKSGLFRVTAENIVGSIGWVTYDLDSNSSTRPR